MYENVDVVDRSDTSALGTSHPCETSHGEPHIVEIDLPHYE
jgi:hypothetical protein